MIFIMGNIHVKIKVTKKKSIFIYKSYKFYYNKYSDINLIHTTSCIKHKIVHDYLILLLKYMYMWRDELAKSVKALHRWETAFEQFRIAAYSINKLIDLFMICHVFISPDECWGRVRFYCAESTYFPVPPVD